jgi:hypothetical protein
MAFYRCFLLNDENHIVGVEADGWESDERAREWAMSFLGKRQSPRIELWEGGRKVAVLERQAAVGPADDTTTHAAGI